MVTSRYANRIKNGTFTIDGVTSHIPENEHSGNDTLHGGFVGYDQGNWTLVASNDTSLTFYYLDDNMSGFPGKVATFATYTVSANTWTSRLVSMALDSPTPIMLANHVYWNLDAFTSGANSTVLNDTLHMPYSDRYIPVDGLEVPLGSLGIVNGTALDFYSKPKTIGQDILNATLCGAGCVGYDNAFILDRPPYSGDQDAAITALSWSSPTTGIKLDVATNQGGLQIYSCVGQNGTIGVKASQEHADGGKSYVQKYGCLVIETQDWIDGINNPQWGRQNYQIFTPDSPPAVNWAQYTFSTVGDDSSP
jgi:aldose 1-epimerase